MNNNALTFIQELQQAKATEVVRNERVRSQFIHVYNSIWQEGGEQAYEREAIYFNQQLRDKERLRRCSGTSTYYAFIELATKGLTLAPGSQALCYLLPRSVKVGTDPKTNQDVRELVCNLSISPFGELLLRKIAGQIRYADNPVIVYEGDTFQFGERDGRKIVNYMSAIPRQSDTIIACYIKITRADGSIDYSVMMPNDWQRLKNYSDRQNTYTYNGQRVTYSNELYGGENGQIDTGFLMAKCIKHAFRSYPKLKLGRGSVLESDIEQQPTELTDPYGTADDENTTPQQEQHYASAPDMSAGVTIDPAQESDNTDDTF